MIVTNYYPPAPLNAYINCLWYSEGIAPYPRLKVLPMPSLHLMINFGDHYHIFEAKHREPTATCAESWSVGLWKTYHVMDWPSYMQIMAVSFKPGGAYPFMQLPLSELHNQIVSLDAIWGNRAAEIREQIYSVPTIQARFALLEQLLLARLNEEPDGLSAVQYAVVEIARSHGALSILDLSNKMGFSRNHLTRQFNRLVGGTPKELARIYRFRRVLFSLDPSQPVEWGEVASQAHYFDQSHFNKDFEVFTGHSPTEFLRLMRQIYTETPILAPKYLPSG